MPGPNKGNSSGSFIGDALDTDLGCCGFGRLVLESRRGVEADWYGGAFAAWTLTTYVVKASSTNPNPTPHTQRPHIANVTFVSYFTCLRRSVIEDYKCNGCCENAQNKYWYEQFQASFCGYVRRRVSTIVDCVLEYAQLVVQRSHGDTVQQPPVAWRRPAGRISR